MAKEFSAEIHVLWVREPLPRHSDLPGEFEEENEAALDYFKERSHEVQAVADAHGLTIPCEMRPGHPAKTIVSYADEEHFDLIVIGHSDHSGLWGRLLGDTADRIADHANCSVLIVK
jgi:nucleotide-binding universal stress UspA family protein